MAGGIVEDIKALMQLTFETHLAYVNRLEYCSMKLYTIQDMFDYFEEYEAFITERRIRIQSNDSVLNGPKVQSSNIEEEKENLLFT